MSRPPFAVILNAQAGRGLAGRQWPRLEAALQQRGLAYRLLDTGSAQEALTALAALPPEYPALAVGGDGTVRALLPELAASGRALGVVPLGTGNDFAGMLGLRPGDFAAALGRLDRPPTRMDLIEAQLEGESPDHWLTLLNGMGMGLDAQVGERLELIPDQVLGLPLSGTLRYVWAALGSVQDRRLETLDVLLDDQLFYSGPSCLVAVMNSTRYGGGFHIAPQADPQDQLLEVVLGGELSRAALLPLMARVRRGTHLGHPQVFHGQARKVSLHWTTPVHTHLDGDLVGKQDGAELRVAPGALLFLSGGRADGNSR